jgi:hypothetical protein
MKAYNADLTNLEERMNTGEISVEEYKSSLEKIKLTPDFVLSETRNGSVYFIDKLKTFVRKRVINIEEANSALEEGDKNNKRALFRYALNKIYEGKYVAGFERYLRGGIELGDISAEEAERITGIAARIEKEFMYENSPNMTSEGLTNKLKAHLEDALGRGVDCSSQLQEVLLRSGDVKRERADNLIKLVELGLGGYIPQMLKLVNAGYLDKVNAESAITVCRQYKKEK